MMFDAINIACLPNISLCQYFGYCHRCHQYFQLPLALFHHAVALFTLIYYRHDDAVYY